MIKFLCSQNCMDQIRKISLFILTTKNIFKRINKLLRVLSQNFLVALLCLLYPTSNIYNILSQFQIITSTNSMSTQELALNLLTNSQINTFYPNQSILCTSPDNQLLITHASTSNLVFLYQIHESEIIAQQVTLLDQSSVTSCVVYRGPDAIEFKIGTTAGIYSGTSGNSALSVGMTFDNEDEPILGIELQSESKQIVYITNNTVINYETNAEAQLDHTYIDPKIIVLESSQNLLQHYIYEREANQFPSVITKLKNNEQSTFSIGKQDQFYRIGEVSLDSTKTIIGVPILNNLKIPVSQVFLTRNLQEITSDFRLQNSNDSPSYKFYSFSKSPNKILLINPSIVDASKEAAQICLSSYQLQSNTLQITEAPLCYSAEDLSLFQEIYLGSDQHYFWNGTTLFHKNNTLGAEDNPELYYPNQYYEYETLIESESTFLELTNGQVALFSPNKLSVELVEPDNYGNIILYIILGILGGLIVFFAIGILIVTMYRAKKQEEEANLTFSKHQSKQKGARPQTSKDLVSFLEECPICVEMGCDFKLNCDHFFHKRCLQEWMKLNSTECPSCKTSLDEGAKRLLM